MDSLLNQAVRNNAFWCEAVLRAHDIASVWTETLWLADTRAPTYYPNLITLSPHSEVQPAITVLHDRMGAGWGIKDSFACLDLEQRGFRIVLEGGWYGREAVTQPTATQNGVSLVASATELSQWCAGWGEGEPDGAPMFPPSLLETDAIAFIHQVEDGTSIAGLAANLSDGVVGISNLFGHGAALGACIDQAQVFAAGRAVVGYGASEELKALQPFEFSRLGPVRVWISSD